MPVADRSAMCWNKGDASISASGLARAGPGQMQVKPATKAAAAAIDQTRFVI
jgi:hypothetical protein